MTNNNNIYSLAFGKRDEGFFKKPVLNFNKLYIIIHNKQDMSIFVLDYE